MELFGALYTPRFVRQSSHESRQIDKYIELTWHILNPNVLSSFCPDFLSLILPRITEHLHGAGTLHADFLEDFQPLGDDIRLSGAICQNNTKCNGIFDCLAASLSLVYWR